MRTAGGATSRRPVAPLLVLLAVLGLVPLGLLASSSIRLTGDAIHRQAAGRVESTAQASAVAMQQRLDGLTTLVQSYAEPHDLDGVRRIAHELRGSAGIFGASALVAVVAELEGHAARGGDEGVVASLVDRVATELDLLGSTLGPA